MPTPVFDEAGFAGLCKRLAKKDPHIKEIIEQHGYPPVWSRKANFETLIHIILEQQVSLASAKAALNKLKEKIGTVTPRKLLLLSDEELKACYFSRQKIVYARSLANAIEDGELSIKKLQTLSDDEIRSVLTKIKGIGNWTVDVFLMMVLHRTDLFPTGDIALMNSVKHVKQLPAHTTKEEIVELAELWRPHRTVAAFVFWHAYIKRKNIRF
ncbi:MAG: DNA-3-methyladenine glycosylase 2 family protein [Sediminibacterium sp.]|nr:DNA-3-methyladenine glycosylase 2 family protein [Sediminibacterium sp.]